MVEASDELRRQIAEMIADYHGRSIQAHTLFRSYELAGELLPLVAAVVAEARTETIAKVLRTVRAIPAWVNIGDGTSGFDIGENERNDVLDAIRGVGNQNAEPERHKVCTCWRLNPDGTHQRGCDFFVADQEGTEQ